MAVNLIHVEVAYGLPARQVVVGVQVAAGASLRDAIAASGLTQEFPDIDLNVNAVGVFGHVRELDDPLRAGDRVEIYRPLLADPKEGRRARAKASK